MNSAFARALTRSAAPVPAEVINTGDRFNVYRNNYLAGLIDTLSAKYPVTIQLVGTEYFEAVARSFVAETPPSSSLLDDYGQEFPDHLGATSTPHTPLYLPDVARLEWARSQAAIAGHTPAMTLISEEDIEHAFEIPLQLTPGAMLITSAYPVGTIWDHHQTTAIRPVPHWSPETVAVWQHSGNVCQQIIPANNVPMLVQLASGIPFCNFMDDITSESHAVQLIGTFTSFVQVGLLVPAIDHTEHKDHDH